MPVTPSCGSDFPYAVFSGVGYVARKPNRCEMTGDGCIFGVFRRMYKAEPSCFPLGNRVLRISHKPQRLSPRASAAVICRQLLRTMDECRAQLNANVGNPDAVGMGSA